MPGEIDWGALLEGKEPEPDGSEAISGLISVDSGDISISDTTGQSISRTPTPTRDRTGSASEAQSFLKLQSVNDLLGQVQSPSPELRTRSASSIKSYVTFSESEPEVFNIAEEINLLSIGDLLPEEQLEEGYETSNESKSQNYSSDKFTEAYSESDEEVDLAEASKIEEVQEEEEEEIYTQDDEISEDIKIKSDGWKNVKNKMLNKGNKIPVFMVGPKKKKFQRDLSFSKDKSEVSQLISSKTLNTSVKSEISSRISTNVSEKSPTKTYNYTSFTEDITTISDSSELETVTKSRTSITEVKFNPPCCDCKCKNQTADINMRPIPLFSGTTLDSKTLAELSAMNPDKIALLNMMKAQYSLTKGLIDITSNILNSEIENCKPTARHTTFEETKEYIRKNQPYKRSKSKHKSADKGNSKGISRKSKRSSHFTDDDVSGGTDTRKSKAKK